MAKVIYLTGLEELEKLDATCKETFRFGARHCRVENAGRLRLVSDLQCDIKKIIKGTPQFIAICRLLPGEDIPDALPIINHGIF